MNEQNTFHGMGIIAAGMISPMNIDNQQRIRRIRYGLKAEEIVSKAKIPISCCDVPDTAALTKMGFRPMVELQSPQPFSLSLGIDLFRQLRSFLLLTRIGHSGMDLCNYINMLEAILGNVKYSWRLSLI